VDRSGPVFVSREAGRPPALAQSMHPEVASSQMADDETWAKNRIEPAQIVATNESLARMVRDISRADAVAFDCEQNGLYAYRSRVCLLQVSCDGCDWIVDPLADVDMGLLSGLFGDSAVVKVFHAAEEDVIGLARDFSLTVAGLFDTMWGAKILGWPRLGLAPILEERHGVKLDKRMQRHDWGVRPLEPAALSYAQLDTHYLLELYREERDELTRRGRIEDALEIFAELAESRAVEPKREPWSYRLKGEKDLSDRGRAVAHALAAARDEMARRRDRPPFKIIGDRELLAIAHARPATVDQLSRVEGVSSRLIKRHGPWLVAAVNEGLKREPPPKPPRKSRDDVAMGRYETMRAWRNAVAAELGIAGEVIVPNDALLVISHEAPSDLGELEALGVLGPRRMKAYGTGLLQAMSGATPQARRQTARRKASRGGQATASGEGASPEGGRSSE
jgi:ribonuclease D